VTGTSDPEIAANIIKAGAYDYIIKDVEFGHLVKLPITVHNALLHSKHVQEIKRYQERLEELVKERTAELRLKDFAIESSLTPFLITSRDALIQYANKAFLETWGASAKEEVIGKKLDEFLKMECDLLAIVSEKGHLLGTGIGKRSDGPHINVEVAINVIRDLEGFPLALVVSLVDITERKRAEEALRESEAQLMQARKIESLGRLAGGVAHDFNNMLAAIIGSAEVLHSDLPQDSSLQSFVSMIMKASQHSRDLVKQLLAFARQQALILEIIDLNKVISGLEEILRRAIRENIQIKMFYANEPCMIEGDRGQIEQILLNLAMNAQDAMPEGGFLTFSTSFGDMSEAIDANDTVSASGTAVVLTVSDNGLGIPQEVIPRIFDPFFTTKEVGKGTGLGLASVYGIIKQHHGNVMVSSIEGKGTIFKVCFPCTQKQAEDAGGAHSNQIVAKSSATILLVEDDESVRNLAQLMLERNGHSVVTATDGEDAFAKLAGMKNKPNLLITDVVMPGLNGPELAQQMGKMLPEIKVLFVSGYAPDVIDRMGIDGKQAVLLIKPYSIKDFIHAVQTLLAAS
jgi:PAS domain S-box-containing protein